MNGRLTRIKALGLPIHTRFTKPFGDCTMGVVEPCQARQIEIVEVGPRDGLQNESVILSTGQKIDFITRAIDAGIKRLEVASFVNPKLVPQMADAEAVIAALPQHKDVHYIGLVLNKRGALRALETAVHELGIVCTASDGFGQRNQGQNAGELLTMATDVMHLCQQEGRVAQVTIATAFGCPFDGEVDPDSVVAMACTLAEHQPKEIALADTIGCAAPGQVAALVSRVAQAIAPIPVRVHFHNTRNTGLANVWAAIQSGAVSIDASFGGLGGCPFAPRATGNVPTEDVVYMLERSGYSTGLDLDRIITAVNWLGDVMGRGLPGMVSKVGAFPCNNAEQSS